MTNQIISQQFVTELKSNYKLNWNGIHGVDHWARVRNIGLKLSQHTGANTKVVELFSFVHDSCRLSDGNDPDHGPRAAKFMVLLNEKYNLLNSHELFDLQNACNFHTRGMTVGFNATILTCWDSDRLDLGRVGIMPKAEYLCTEIARRDEVIKWAYLHSTSGMSE